MDLLEITKKLVGEISAHEKPNTTNIERLENMKVICDYAEKLLHHIDYNACNYFNPKDKEIQEIQNHGVAFLNKIGFRND